MNLHEVVRGAINAVNPDITATYSQSTGYMTDAGFSRTPTYSTQTVTIQVQPVSREDLRHIDFLNLEGVFRSVYLYPNAQGVVRPSQTGGDTLTFPQVIGGEPQVWLVVAVPETWQGVGWSRVIVCLQEDVVN